MRLISVAQIASSVELNADEALLLNNALNEVLNGIYI